MAMARLGRAPSRGGTGRRPSAAARDAHDALLHRSAQRLEHFAPVEGELVEEEDPDVDECSRMFLEAKDPLTSVGVSVKTGSNTDAGSPNAIALSFNNHHDFAQMTFSAFGSAASAATGQRAGRARSGCRRNPRSGFAFLPDR
jgi:hypothetical protein